MSRDSNSRRPLASPVDFGREVCGDLKAAGHREWLVTNGIGGFASGTIAGHLTRRYHGLLVAALQPPLGRTLLVTKLEETAEYAGQAYSLSTNRWADGTVSPEGFRYIERFRLDGTTPVWTYACADALVEKRIWMQPGANTTYVQYTALRGGPVRLELRALVNYRDYHSTTHAGDWRMEIAPVEGGLRVRAFDAATPFYLLSSALAFEPAHAWYRNFDLAVERYRGLDDREDHLHVGTFRAALAAGESVALVLTTDPAAERDARAAWAVRHAHERNLVERWTTAHPALAEHAPVWVRQLVLAADQFLVARLFKDELRTCSVIAGYPWFGDWGRDTMIALPGLALSTGRPEIARSILRAFARFTSQGMLPNLFPDVGEQPAYNTVDAALWYFEAARQYFAATQDAELLRELFPLLANIIDWHVRGTRYGIRADPADGLLAAGEPGVQLTWMDAKVGDWVVTPRIGKPVEVNALWLNALVTMVGLARVLGRPTGSYECLAKAARNGFQRFWNAAAGYCFDVLDGPLGNEDALRPNQIFAVSLPESPLDAKQQRGVVEACARHLVASHGLRSLAPADPHYTGHYQGGRVDRDGAYHQGTVWGWLLGPFVLAHLRVFGDASQAATFLDPMAHHLTVHGLGTASEIFDGDPPFTPRGCIAQAWTVAELLRAWHVVNAAVTELPANRTVPGTRRQASGAHS